MDNRRKKYFIDNVFQSQFIIKFCLICFIICLLLIEIIYLMSFDSFTTVFENSRFVVKTTGDFLLPILLIGFSLILILGIFFTVYIVKRLTHSISGPLHRFTLDIKKITKGNLNLNIHLRDTDQLGGLKDEMNNMINILNEKMHDIQSKVSDLKSEVKTGKLKEKVDDLEKDIRFFKL